MLSWSPFKKYPVIYALEFWGCKNRMKSGICDNLPLSRWYTPTNFAWYRICKTEFVQFMLFVPSARTLERAAILKTNIIFQVKTLQVGILIWEKQIFIAFPVYCIQCYEPNLCGSEHVLVTSEREMKCMKIVQSGTVYATDLN